MKYVVSHCMAKPTASTSSRKECAESGRRPVRGGVSGHRARCVRRNHSSSIRGVGQSVTEARRKSPLSVNGKVKAPQLISMVQLVYPPLLRRTRFQGDVRLMRRSSRKTTW
jgi:hypothetical protein